MSIEKAFDFTADDLAANQHGKLSARQQEKRAKRRRIRRWATRLALLLFVGSEALVIGILCRVQRNCRICKNSSITVENTTHIWADCSLYVVLACENLSEN
jgi:hypothetical protein